VRRYKHGIKSCGLLRRQSVQRLIFRILISPSSRVAIFDLYSAFITLISFPSGILMHFSAHQTQQQLAACERLKSKGCGHENHSQSSSSAKQGWQSAVFWAGLPPDAPVRGILGEVCCIHSDFPQCSLKLRCAMKHIQVSQFDPARLFTYMLSRLVESHAAQADQGKERISSGQAAALGRGQSSTSSSSGPEEILRTAERRWPTRYY
jgi:hypothetical protein